MYDYFLIDSFIKMRIISSKPLRENQNKDFTFNNILRKIVPWKNVVQPDKQQISIQ